MRDIVYYIVMADAFTAMICTCSLGSVTEKIVFVSSALTLLLLSAYAIACKDEGKEENDKPDFKRFLEKRGAYEPFCKNLRNQKGLSFEEYMGTLFLELDAVSSAFTWSETLEGIDYWHIVCEAWRREVDNAIVKVTTNLNHTETWNTTNRTN